MGAPAASSHGALGDSPGCRTGSDTGSSWRHFLHTGSIRSCQRRSDMKDTGERTSHRGLVARVKPHRGVSASVMASATSHTLAKRLPWERAFTGTLRKQCCHLALSVSVLEPFVRELGRMCLALHQVGFNRRSDRPDHQSVFTLSFLAALVCIWVMLAQEVCGIRASEKPSESYGRVFRVRERCRRSDEGQRETAMGNRLQMVSGRGHFCCCFGDERKERLTDIGIRCLKGLLQILFKKSV